MRALRDDTRGLSTVEYILILVIVAITALLLWQTFGSSVGSRVDQATQSVTGMERAGGGAVAVAGGDSAGSATAMAITEGRQGGSEGGGSAMGMAAAAGGGGEGGGESAGRARPAGAAEGAGAGFGEEGDGENGEASEIAESGMPDLFLWIGWLLVLILGAVTVFSVLGKRIGKSK